MRKAVASSMFVTALLVACSGGAVYSAPPAPTPSEGAAPWSLPSDPMSLVRQAGLDPGNA